ncbi:MAG TPA: phosphoenolpyruvate kinase [Thermoanaerobaculia bacterium]|nr:phosphoenolpyruvate kinase [Thermoanaerobaculia bacterium]
MTTPTTLTSKDLDSATAELPGANAEFVRRYRGESQRRQPVHTVYGGAHVFHSNTARRLGELALEAVEGFAPDARTFAEAVGLPEALAPAIYTRVLEKLRTEPVEDYRIDFEDGYGNRSDVEEDGHAVSAAREVATGRSAHTLPHFLGIRIKPLSEELRARSLRTLDIFLTRLLSDTDGYLPENFVVTLAKVTVEEQVAALAKALDRLEAGLRLPPGRLELEIMVETPQAIVNSRGESNVLRLVEAAGGRCIAAHFGTYDYTAALSITAAHQNMGHPACDFARHMMQVSLAGTGVWLSDGATNVLPVPRQHPAERTLRGREIEEDKTIVHHAWRTHYRHIRHSLASGYYQGWDLHPAQLPTRYAALYAFFLEGLDAASARLRNFVEKAGQATLVGEVFDDAATGQGLLNYFLRAVACGALTEDEASERTGLTLAELQGRSFVRILRNRRR